MSETLSSTIQKGKKTTKKGRKKKNPKIFIQIVLDRSGSMSWGEKNTLEGFNKFLAEQKKLPGEATISLVRFDNEYIRDYTLPIAEAPNLTSRTFQPRGGTALNDAVGRAIDELDTKEYDQVLFVIFTDGHENASVEYPGVGNQAIQSKIAKKFDEGWQFAYMGANQDAHKVSAAIGGQRLASSSYTYDQSNSAAAFAAMSSATSVLRSGAGGQSVDFFAGNRDEEVSSDVS